MNNSLSLSTDPYPLLLDQAISSAGLYNSLVSGFSELGTVYPLTFLHCLTAKFSHLLNKKPVKYRTFAQYMQQKSMESLTARFHGWLLHENMLASHFASCGAILHPRVLRVSPDLQYLFWNFSTRAHQSLRLSVLHHHPLWHWSPHHQQTHNSNTGKSLGKKGSFIAFSAMLFLSAFWWSLMMWRERWTS